MRVHIAYNHQTGFYEATEKGITYQMELSEMDSLKKTISPTVADWYLSLPFAVRNKINRLGIRPRKDDDFYPDAEYE